MKRITVNGRERTVSDLSDLSYSRLCYLAEKDERQDPTATWSTPDGRSGTVERGQRAPLVSGGVYNVMVTGNA